MKHNQSLRNANICGRQNGHSVMHQRTVRGKSGGNSWEAYFMWKYFLTIGIDQKTDIAENIQVESKELYTHIRIGVHF